MSGKPFVFVLDCNKKPLMPCTGKRARLLLNSVKQIKNQAEKKLRETPAMVNDVYNSAKALSFYIDYKRND